MGAAMKSVPASDSRKKFIISALRVKTGGRASKFTNIKEYRREGKGYFCGNCYVKVTHMRGYYFTDYRNIVDHVKADPEKTYPPVEIDENEAGVKVFVGGPPFGGFNPNAEAISETADDNLD